MKQDMSLEDLTCMLTHTHSLPNSTETNEEEGKTTNALTQKDKVTQPQI